MLVKEPFFLSPAEIGKLSPFQVQHLFFRDAEREDAKQSVSPQQAESSVWQMFLKACLAKGKSEAEAKAAWDKDTKAREAGRADKLKALKAKRDAGIADAQAKWAARRQRQSEDILLSELSKPAAPSPAAK